jgi:hypothetical protein
MKKRVLGIIAIGFLTAVVTKVMPTHDADGATVPQSDSVQFHEGQLFPATVFPSILDGRPRSIADFRGKKVILHIFASW